MRVIFFLSAIFVGAQCTSYDVEVYKIEAKNSTLLLVDASTNYAANDAAAVYAVSVLEDLFADKFEVEYDFQDEGSNSFGKDKINSCETDTNTLSGTAMTLLLKSLGCKEGTCPLEKGDYKIEKEYRIEDVDLGADAMDLETIYLCINVQQIVHIEIYLYKVI